MMNIFNTNLLDYTYLFQINNVCNAYLFQRIDDILDRVPNSKIEENYGSFTPDRVDEVSPFWKTVLGDDYEREIDVISFHNRADRSETIKTLNFFSIFFKEMQDISEEIIHCNDHEHKKDLQIALSENSRFTSWVALQLCTDVKNISGIKDISPEFRLDIFTDCGIAESQRDLECPSRNLLKRMNHL